MTNFNLLTLIKMKKSLFLYLFVFTLLICLFQLVQGNNQFNVLSAEIQKLNKKLDEKNEYISDLETLNERCTYFDYDSNQEAQNYHQNMGVSGSLEKYIWDDLLSYNNAEKGNSLIPYKGDENNFMINKVKLLNHKWLIADFSDSKNWGEITFRYFIDDDNNVDYELMDALIYSNR